ncbi:hypothetical protein LSG31_05195 [Fodinisporobacter ferrooxydans]|uniref:Uncharacterized protein n=1 Tax=Fodinisporobacter ferrooxydans TaxID=2901836 RepID=A0ABY4CMC8_9BACL|nr:hypothetical protein LSG31_05195 [Alicyclobacillaceae bacterium MYW30-H2]
MDNNNIIQKGLNAAKQVAAESRLTNQVEELAAKLGQAVAQPSAQSSTQQARDGLRYDYDDASDV